MSSQKGPIDGLILDTLRSKTQVLVRFKNEKSGRARKANSSDQNECTREGPHGRLYTNMYLYIAIVNTTVGTPSPVRAAGMRPFHFFAGSVTKSQCSSGTENATK
jgi:hypothetical protein